MNNYNAAGTPLDTGEKLKRETNNEFVNATLYKQIIGSLRYLWIYMLLDELKVMESEEKKVISR